MIWIEQFYVAIENYYLERNLPYEKRQIVLRCSDKEEVIFQYINAYRLEMKTVKIDSYKSIF